MKILIVDDHPLFLAGLRALFKLEKEMEICGEAKNGQEAISQAKQLKPDVVIMDINMPGVNGIDATRKILSMAANTKILALSIHSDKRFVKEMLDAGAVGYLLKDDAPEELVKAIEITSNGDMFLSPRITRVALSNDETEGKTKGQGISEVSGIEIKRGQKERLNILTFSEIEILKYISRGLQNKEIADELYKSELTIKKHISNMLQKMQVRNRLSLVTKAKEIGII